METLALRRPATDEYDPYFETYVSLAPEEEIVPALRAQGEATQELVRGIDDTAAAIRPAAGEWCLKEVIGHLTDAERVFSYRMLRFSRGDFAPLAAFDQDQFVAAATFASRPLAELLEELGALRKATVYLVGSFAPGAALNRGVAFQGETSVRAIAWITLGHERKHLQDVRRNFPDLVG